MTEQGLQKLSEAQKDCLRLVGAGLELKEVARTLRISPTAVTERLRLARQNLGVGTSREAARLLARHEGGAGNMQHVDMPDVVAAEPPIPVFSTSSVAASGSAGSGPGGVFVREEQQPYLAAGPLAGPRLPWPFPTTGRKRNDLSGWQTLAMVMILTIGLGIAALVAISIVDQLSRIRLG